MLVVNLTHIWLGCSSNHPQRHCMHCSCCLLVLVMMFISSLDKDTPLQSYKPLMNCSPFKSSVWSWRTLSLHKKREANAYSISLYVVWGWWLKASRIFFLLLQILFITQSSCYCVQENILRSILMSFIRPFSWALSIPSSPHTWAICSFISQFHAISTVLLLTTIVLA